MGGYADLGYGRRRREPDALEPETEEAHDAVTNDSCGEGLSIMAAVEGAKAEAERPCTEEK